MPGPATNFVILDQTIGRLSSAPDGGLRAISEIMSQHSAYAHLGALGPSIADFIPSDPVPAGTAGGNQYLNLWKQVLGIVGDGMAVGAGLSSVLQRMVEFLDKIDIIAANEDVDALKDMVDELDVITETAADLRAIVNHIPLLAAGIAGIIGTGMKPAICVAPGDSVPPWPVWKIRDVLFWKHSGAFTEALINRAEQAGDPRFQAYAYGYLTSYSANVVGNPFINSIVGGPYRTQWWRHRWISNFIDTWAHGAYASGATMMGDTPTPPYSDWPSLCDASLHERIAIVPIEPQDVMRSLWNAEPLPSILPSDFGEFWYSAFTDVYGSPTPDYPVTPESLNGAYIMTWMTLWFQTSGEVLGCNPSPSMAPPAGCGDAPSWADPTVPGDSGSGSMPPTPEVELDGDTGAVVSGAILAILGALTLLTPAWPLGAAAIAGGASLIAEGWPEPKWAELRCDLHWYRLYLYNGLKALHEIMVLGAIAPPYAWELANDETVLSLLGTEYRYDSGKATVKSQYTDRFPSACWDGGLATWTQRPASVEMDPTVGYLASAYPSFFIADDLANPLANGDVKTAGQNWPYRIGDEADLPILFGNAAANAVDLIAHLPSFPNWNLDGDRGLAFFTWQFKNSVGTDPVEIEPEI